MCKLILINSRSGNGKGLKIINEIEHYLIQKKEEYRIYIDNWCEDLDLFSEVWVIGGDGTLNYFINKYQNIKIPISIFKGGTGNDFAWKLYGSIDLHEQLEIIINSKGKLVDVGSCNNKLFLNGVGIGFDGEILKNMQHVRWLGGHIGYFLIVLKKIFSFKERLFTLSFSNKSISSKFLLMSIFNSSRTGGGFHIAPNAIINDGFLNLIMCKPLSIFKRLFYLPEIEKGKHLSLPFIDHHLIKNITISCEEETAAQIDGELFYAKEFKIELFSSKISFLY